MVVVRVVVDGAVGGGGGVVECFQVGLIQHSLGHPQSFQFVALLQRLCDDGLIGGDALGDARAAIGGGGGYRRTAGTGAAAFRRQGIVRATVVGD